MLKDANWDKILMVLMVITFVLSIVAAICVPPKKIKVFCECEQSKMCMVQCQCDKK